MKQANPSALGGVTIQGDVVVKIQEPRASRRERLRTLAGREVGQRTGLFVVPEILSYDDERGEIVFERLSLMGLREALADSTRSMELVSRVAAALAAIHDEMEVMEGSAVAAPAVELNRPPVPLHGDFAIRNLFYLADSDRLAIIDWSNAWWIGFDAEEGPPEIDVAVFLMSLFHRRLWGPSPIARLHAVARRFLATYAAASPHGLDVRTLAMIVATSTPRFHQKTRRSKGRLRALGYRHNMLELKYFMRRLPHHGFAG